MNKEKWKNIKITGIIIGIFIIFFLCSVAVRKCLNSVDKDDVVLVGDTLTSEGKVMEFEYKNHKFINLVKLDVNGKSESFVIHDPNCRCLSKKLNNITTVITNNDNHNIHSSDSIVKTNFRVVISKLATIQNNNIELEKQIKTLRTEVTMLRNSVNKLKPTAKKQVVIRKKK